MLKTLFGAGVQIKYLILKDNALIKCDSAHVSVVYCCFFDLQFQSPVTP